MFDRKKLLRMTFCGIVAHFGLVCGDKASAEELKGLTVLGTQDPTHFRFEYKPDDGSEPVTGLYAFPKGIGPFRVVIINHSPGGSALQVMYNYAPPFLERSYATITVDLKYEKNPEESDVTEMMRRIKVCFAIMDHDERFDAKRVYMFGNGYGAMATIAVAAQTDRVKAIALSGSGWLPKGGLAYDKITTPVILVHGRTDETISVEEAAKLKSNLERAGKTVEMKIVDNSGHEVITLKTAEVFEAIASFFKKYEK